MYDTDDEFFAAFRGGAIEPAAFDHRAHLRAAICALTRLPFLDACVAVRDGLGHVAARAGKPALYHETLTVALMSLIADAIAAEKAVPCSRFDMAGFVERHPLLVDRTAIARRYRRETFEGDAARRRFRLPDAGVEASR